MPTSLPAAWLRRPATRELVALALLVLATAIAYAPAFRGEFLWDDNLYVRDNPVLRSADGLRQIWMEPLATPQYHPLVFTTYWAEYHLWGADPLGYHLGNVALHVLNTILLWRLLHRLSVPGAFLAAALFALHPVHVESVAWITERKDVLSVCFYLLTMLAWVRYLEAPSHRRYAAVLVLFLCTLFSKTVLCTLPLAALLVAWWRDPRGWRRAVPAAAVLFVLSVAFGLLTMWREYQHGNPPLPLSDIDRVLIAGRALWFYTRELLWPSQLTAIYPQWQVEGTALWSYAFPVGVLVVLVVVWGLRSRLGTGPCVAVAFFVLTLSPMLGLLDNNFMRLSYVADHFPYLASCGLMALAAAAVAVLMRRVDAPGRWLGWAACTLVVVVLGLLTWRQAGIYRNAETFWSDNIAKNPRSWMGHNNLAGALARQARLDEATQHLAEAVRLKPDYATAHNHWAIILDRQGQLDAALEHYAAALAADPSLPDVHNNIGTILFRQGKLQDAFQHFSAAVRLNPSYAEAHNHLGLTAAQLGRPDVAIAHFQEALRIKPDYAPAQRNLDRALAPGGQGAPPPGRDTLQPVR